MKQERRAYEWSILSYTLNKNNEYGDDDPDFADEDLRDDDPHFADELKYLFRWFGKDNPFIKEKRFTKVRFNDLLYNGKKVFGNLEMKLWRLDKNGDWDNDYAQIEDGTGKILPSDYYGWKVPKKYQNELNKYLVDINIKK